MGVSQHVGIVRTRMSPVLMWILEIVACPYRASQFSWGQMKRNMSECRQQLYRQVLLPNQVARTKDSALESEF